MKESSRLRVALAAAALFAIASAGGAVAAELFTGADIKDESVSSADVKGLKTKDLSKGLRNKLEAGGPQGPPGVQGAPGVALPGNGAYSFEGVLVPIPEHGLAGDPLQVAMQVPSAEGPIGELRVFLGIGHTFNGDLDVTLTHETTGTSVPLFTDVSGTDEGLIVILDDDAATDMGAADNPADGAVAGTFNPEGAAVLSAFDGLDASGTWRLTVDDDTAAGADIGDLVNWTLYVD